MASTVDDLLACRGFGEAVEEWDLRSQQSDGPPASEDGSATRRSRTIRKTKGESPRSNKGRNISCRHDINTNPPRVPVTRIAGTCRNVLPERCDSGRLDVFQ